MAVGTLSRPLPHQNNAAEHHRGKYYGRYMGFVRDREDPEKRGRVRIHIPAILPGPTERENLWSDWAYPEGGKLSVPPLGSPVWVQFENGQVQYPVYSWGHLRGEDAEDSEAPKAGKGEQDPTWKPAETVDAGGFGPAQFSATAPADPAIETPPIYSFNKAFESEGGQIFELDDSTDQVRARYAHPSGTSVLVDNDGSVLMRAAGALIQECDGDFIVKLKAGSTFRIVYPNGSSISLGAQGFVVKSHQISLNGRIVMNNGDHI